MLQMYNGAAHYMKLVLGYLMDNFLVHMDLAEKFNEFMDKMDPFYPKVKLKKAKYEVRVDFLKYILDFQDLDAIKRIVIDKERSVLSIELFITRLISEELKNVDKIFDFFNCVAPKVFSQEYSSLGNIYNEYCKLVSKISEEKIRSENVIVEQYKLHRK